MAHSSLTQLYLAAIDQYSNPKAQMYRTACGWASVSGAEMLRRVAALAKALAVLGIKPGDRVGLLAPNCPEWHIADFAVLGLGAVDVPVYFNESTERLAYILNDSGAKIVFVAGDQQIRQVAVARERVPGLEHIVAVSPPADSSGDILHYETLIAGAAEADVTDYRKQALGIFPDQLATIIYTSGTTGEPKGVMLNHANLSSNALDSSRAHEFTSADLALSFLPLAHVFERMVDYSYFFRGITIAYVAQIEQVAQALLEVHPTTTCAVPRFFEKIYANIVEKGHREIGLKRKTFDWAMHVAEEAEPWRIDDKSAPMRTKLSWHAADRLVYSKIREGVGGRIRAFISGGAPLAPELARFFWSIGLPIYQGYGLTETSPAVTSNVPKANKVGTVGRPIPNVEVRIADDGEILVRGGCIMQGYYRKPDQTRDVLTSDGWFKTGDIGHLDSDGYLVITDRKKELLKTAAGKFVAPQLIENRLKSSPFILNAIVVGDKRKFVSVLVVPNFATVEVKAREAGRTLSSPEEIARDPWVRELLGREVDRLCDAFAQFEKPKRFAVLPEDFTIANGQLTLTMKMKRRVIEQKYKDLIETLYAGVEEPRPQSA